MNQSWELSAPIRRRLEGFYLRLCESNHRQNEEGQSMVEYAFILLLIAMVVIVILQVIGNQVKNTFSNVHNGLNGG